MMTTEDRRTIVNVSHEPMLCPSRGLKPFDHQVAGQSLIFRYDESTICKCLAQREYKFYQAAPLCLKEFMPQFRGVIQLYLPDPDLHNLHPSYSCPKLPHQPAPHQQNSITCPQEDEVFHSAETVGGLRLEPNRLRALKKTSRSWSDMSSSVYNFLLLEDLIAKYSNPCILDLKIGVRQHGDDASAEKIAYQVKKCQNTTSTSLGIRMCGMKKYNFSTGEYETRDKSFGRRLTDVELKSQIADFLFNGQFFRMDLVDSMLLQLTNLKSAIEQLESFRFYSCSLLITYEGCVEDVEETLDESPPSRDRNDSEVSTDSFKDQDSSSENDGDSGESGAEEMDDIVPELARVDSEPECACNEILKDDPLCFCDDKVQLEANEKCSKCYINVPSPVHETSTNNSGGSSSWRHQRNLVDVRIVDFAHATFDGFAGDTVRHCGPDHGFLLGVNTLIEVLTDMKAR